MKIHAAWAHDQDKVIGKIAKDYNVHDIMQLLIATFIRNLSYKGILTNNLSALTDLQPASSATWNVLELAGTSLYALKNDSCEIDLVRIRCRVSKCLIVACNTASVNMQVKKSPEALLHIAAYGLQPMKFTSMKFSWWMTSDRQHHIAIIRCRCNDRLGQSKTRMVLCNKKSQSLFQPNGNFTPWTSFKAMLR
jgi:hypothetical protein